MMKKKNHIPTRLRYLHTIADNYRRLRGRAAATRPLPHRRECISNLKLQAANPSC